MLSVMLLVTQGCFLPVPHQRLHSHGVKGWIVDENGNPIPHAIVVENDVVAKENTTPKQKAITDPDGYFELKPVRKWHGAFCVAPPSDFSLFPFFHNPPDYKEIYIMADGFPEQNFSFRSLGFGFEEEFARSKYERDYFVAEKIILYPQAVSNYLATVMHGFQNGKLDVASVLLWEKDKNGWLELICSTTDATIIATILTEMAVPAEMTAKPTTDTPDEDILCYMAFLDSSSNIIPVGHILYYDGTIKNNYVSSVHRTVLWQATPDVTWRIKSKSISNLAYDVLSKIKKRPDVSPWKEEENTK